MKLAAAPTAALEWRRVIENYDETELNARVGWVPTYTRTAANPQLPCG